MKNNNARLKWHFECVSQHLAYNIMWFQIIAFTLSADNFTALFKYISLLGHINVALQKGSYTFMNLKDFWFSIKHVET